MAQYGDYGGGYDRSIPREEFFYDPEKDRVVYRGDTGGTGGVREGEYRIYEAPDIYGRGSGAEGAPNYSGGYAGGNAGQYPELSGYGNGGFGEYRNYQAPSIGGGAGGYGGFPTGAGGTAGGYPGGNPYASLEDDMRSSRARGVYGVGGTYPGGNPYASIEDDMRASRAPFSPYGGLPPVGNPDVGFPAPGVPVDTGGGYPAPVGGGGGQVGGGGYNPGGGGGFERKPAWFGGSQADWEQYTIFGNERPTPYPALSAAWDAVHSINTGRYNIGGETYYYGPGIADQNRNLMPGFAPTSRDYAGNQLYSFNAPRRELSAPTSQRWADRWDRMNAGARAVGNPAYNSVNPDRYVNPGQSYQYQRSAQPMYVAPRNAPTIEAPRVANVSRQDVERLQATNREFNALLENERERLGRALSGKEAIDLYQKFLSRQ